ncbi:MAG TPA: hypothetical protein VG297_01540 [Bryobacteraceae bacterium]|jgi:hypothetical protein|nr:hypothetical protein [Bryobacteraceae bacterium]
MTQVAVGNLIGMGCEVCGESRQVGFECPEIGLKLNPTIRDLCPRIGEPVSQKLNGFPWRAMMAGDVVSGKVRERITKSLRRRIEHKKILGVLLSVRTEVPATYKQSEFEQHIEARKAGCVIQRLHRDIVNAVPAGRNQFQNSDNSWLGISRFQGAPQGQTEPDKRENDRSKLRREC